MVCSKGCWVAYNGKEISTSQTTPSSYELNNIFSLIKKEEITNCVMEVSSIALKTNRVYGLNYDIGMYTNLTQAHITAREHPDFEDYFAAKKRIFKISKKIIINNDDSTVRKAAEQYINSPSYKIIGKRYIL